MSIKNHHPLVLLFFFLTGATGLIYELVWTRILILTFGSTHFAITTVLTTFMTGLALGSLLFGKLVDKKSSPLRMYAFIELAIGIYCFLTPAVFAGIKYLYIEVLPPSQQFVTFNPYQFFLSFLGIIFPATLMGGTLPAVIKYFSETQREMAIKSGAEQTFNIGLSSGLLYAINTLGAVTGTLATGTFLLFFFGIQNSLYLAGTIDIFIALALLAGFSFRKTRPEHHDESQKREPSFDADKKEHFTIRVVPYCFLFSGFASLAYEVLWTRVLTLVLGSSIYAFTIILTAFLAGISAGSILFSNFKKRGISSVDLFAALEALIAIAAICSIFLFANLPYIFGKLHLAFSGSFWLFLLLQFGICLAVMLLPTVCMGATFPVVSDIYAKGVTTVGRRIGNIYFFNTVGAIFGSFTAGFIMVPRFGIQTSIWLVALVNLAIFSLLIILKEGSERRKKIGATICAIIVPLFLITNLPKWDKNIMTLGPYVTPVYQEGGISGRSKRLLESELLLYREGLNAVISVRERGNHILYQANGKVEAKMIDNKPSEAWYLLGHIPLLLTPDAEEALLVGLGSGVTLGAMAEYPLKGIDVVELEPAVVEASAFFSPAHHDPLKDPRVDLHITDGRGFLSSARKNYDVIISG
ncbi:MAG: fused MFS/spermidine synthase, partial [Nitrospinota bacterium]